MQLIAEFDRIVGRQNGSLLVAKLHWLELVPKILEAVKSEGNEHCFTKDRKPVMKVCLKRLCTNIHALFYHSGTTNYLLAYFMHFGHAMV